MIRLEGFVKEDVAINLGIEFEGFLREYFESVNVIEAPNYTLSYPLSKSKMAEYANLPIFVRNRRILFLNKRLSH